jgi:hypothetical protein
MNRARILLPSLLCCRFCGNLPFVFSPQLMDELLCGRLCVATMSLGMSKLALAIAVRWVQPLLGLATRCRHAPAPASSCTTSARTRMRRSFVGHGVLLCMHRCFAIRPAGAWCSLARNMSVFGSVIGATRCVPKRLCAFSCFVHLPGFRLCARRSGHPPPRVTPTSPCCPTDPSCEGWPLDWHSCTPCRRAWVSGSGRYGSCLCVSACNFFAKARAFVFAK